MSEKLAVVRRLVELYKERTGMTEFGPSAAEILVRPDHESLDPVCDGVKRS